MAYDDLEDDELDDQDKPKPKPQAPPQAIGTPIQPTTGTPVGSPDSGRFQDVRPIQAPPQQSSTAIAPIMPDASVAPPSNSSIGTPIVPSAPIGPSAPRPAGDRAAAMAAQGPPQYHGFNKFLDTLGRVTNVGRAIESLGGYGTLGYDTKLGRADTQAQAEERQIEGGEHERQAKATLEETEARTGKENQATEASKAGMQNVMITLPDGRQISVPQGQLGPDVRAMITQQGAGQRTTATNQSREDIAAGNNETKEDIATQHSKDVQSRLQTQRTIADANNKVRQEIASARVNAAGNKLAPQILKQAQTAQTILPQLDKLEAQTYQVAEQLGPLAGRWNDLWTNKIGAPNPEFANYMAQMTFLESAVTLAHSQGRVSNLIFEQFKNLYDVGKQSPENMVQFLHATRDWMHSYADILNNPQGGNAPNAGGGAGGAGGQAPTKDSKWQQSNGKYRYSNDGGKTWNNYTQP